MRREPFALRVALLLLRGERLDFVNDRVDAVVEILERGFERLELTLARGDGDFLRAQISLGLLEAGLQRGLLALERALLVADAVRLRLGLLNLRLESGNLVLAAQDGGRGFPVRSAAQGAAGENALAVEQIARERGEVVSSVARLPRRRGRSEVGDDARVAEQSTDEIGDGFIRLDHL